MLSPGVMNGTFNAFLCEYKIEMCLAGIFIGIFIKIQETNGTGAFAFAILAGESVTDGKYLCHVCFLKKKKTKKTAKIQTRNGKQSYSRTFTKYFSKTVQEKWAKNGKRHMHMI